LLTIATAHILFVPGTREPALTFIAHSGNLVGIGYSAGKMSCGNAHTMEAVMKIRHFLLGATAAIGLGVAAASAEAAPVAGAGDLTSAVREASNVDQVYWSRRCWRYGGHLRCRRHWVDYGYSPYYSYDPYPYYYRPSFGFFFGGHRHHHRHW
jgi:hypothetical protein